MPACAALVRGLCLHFLQPDPPPPHHTIIPQVYSMIWCAWLHAALSNGSTQAANFEHSLRAANVTFTNLIQPPILVIFIIVSCGCGTRYSIHV